MPMGGSRRPQVRGNVVSLDGTVTGLIRTITPATENVNEVEKNNSGNNGKTELAFLTQVEVEEAGLSEVKEN